MDCEMVGLGSMKESALSGVSIVNEFRYCLNDKFVKPKLEVTDYQTHNQYRGVREYNLKNGKHITLISLVRIYLMYFCEYFIYFYTIILAMPFHNAAEEVARLRKNHIIVGHSLKSVLGMWYLGHPKPQQRDAAT